MNDYDSKFASEVGKRLARAAVEEQQRREYAEYLARVQAAQQCVERTDCTHIESCPEKPDHCSVCTAYVSRSR